jgi:RNA polymerase sigma factor (sigma-70 family)
MPPSTENLGAMPGRAGIFHTTHWSIVLLAKKCEGIEAEAALEKLCHTYWPPLYGFIRRQGYSVDDAQDLTQEFLSRLIRKEWLNHLKHRDGKFRSFLLTFLKHFLSDHRDRRNAQKRGGGKQMISLDACEEEEQEAMTPTDGLTAEQHYERRWARAVMREAVNKLQSEYDARGKSALFSQLKELQPGEHGEKSYAEIAASLGVTVQAIKSARNAFNHRYAELIRDEIARTVADSCELEAEIQYLMQIFSR